MIDKTDILIGSLIILAVILGFTASVSAALSISSIETVDLNPGEMATFKMTLENNFDKDIEDVSITLNFQGLPLSPVGSSEISIDEIGEDDDETVAFTVRAASIAAPGDYQIPFTMTYKNSSQPKSGTIGLRIKGTVELETILTAEKPVVGSKDKLTVRIVNKGFADARYVSLTLAPSGFTISSDKTVYIGDISANDFETAVFDVVYTSENPVMQALMEYRDFNNELQTKIITQEVEVYTQEEAIKRGIIEKNNAPLYIGIVVAIIVIWIIWRAVRRRQRLKRSMQAS